jgi:hypothetical protein
MASPAGPWLLSGRQAVQLSGHQPFGLRCHRPSQGCHFPVPPSADCHFAAAAVFAEMMRKYRGTKFCIFYPCPWLRSRRAPLLEAYAIAILLHFYCVHFESPTAVCQIYFPIFSTVYSQWLPFIRCSYSNHKFHAAFYGRFLP